MLELILKTTKYRFIQGMGTDWLEGHQSTMEKILGRGVIEFSNKMGGVMDVIFLGDISMTKKAIIIQQIEQECEIIFIGQDDAYFKPEYEKTLRRIHGDKVIIK